MHPIHTRRINQNHILALSAMAAGLALAAVPGIDTWRQWAWPWHAAPGRHLIEARATDKTGYTQTPRQAPPEPNGATGYPMVSVPVR